MPGVLNWIYDYTNKVWVPVKSDPNGVQEVYDPKVFNSLVAYEGTATSDGPDASTIVDTVLAGKPDYNHQLVVITSGSYQGQTKTIDQVTTGENVHVAVAFDGIITSGTTFLILAILPTTAVVAAIEDKLDHAEYGLQAQHQDISHVPKFAGSLWWVAPAPDGDDDNDGKTPETPFLTIGHTIATAAAGDRIYVKAGTYAEDGRDLSKDGLELVCEQGTVLTNSTPGTVLTVSGDHCRVVGAILFQLNQIGINITGSFASIEDCLAFICGVGFDVNGAETHFNNCRSILHSVTGFDIAGSYGIYDKCVAMAAAAVRGFYLSSNTADHNGFHDCHTLGNTIAGWQVADGAQNNLFTKCSMGAGDGVRVPGDATNTWDDFSDGSKIVAGQSRDQDLKDIYDKTVSGGGLTTFKQEAVAATNANGTAWVDILDKSAITKPTKICGFKVTIAGGWAGKAWVRIVDGSDNKIFPFQDYYEQDAGFTSGTQVAFNFVVVVPVADGYKFQFCSSNDGDGDGKTLQLNNLDVIEVG